MQVRTLPAALDWRLPVGIAGAAYLALIVFGLIPYGEVGGDARAYWSVNLTDPYTGHLGGGDAFLYSPAIALTLWPFTFLPWPLFYALLTAASLGTLIWLRVPWAIALPPVLDCLVVGNVHILYAGVIVAGLRYPAAWAFPLLTKVTPGIGIWWYAVRREWRSLAIALGVTALIAVTTAILLPTQWADWLALLASSYSRAPGTTVIGVPLVWRLVLAGAVLTWGALTGRRWTIAVAVVLAAPVLWMSALAVLVAIPRLRHDSSEAEAGSQEQVAGSIKS